MLYYLRERLTGHPASTFYDALEEAHQAQGHSELLAVVEDSGRVHGLGFGFGPKERPRMGQKRVDPAWAMTVRDQLARLRRLYYLDAGQV
jgi:hypothetical protein